MFRFGALKQNKKEAAVNEKVGYINKSLEGKYLTKSMEENIAMMEEIFKDDDTLKIRRIQNKANPEVWACAIFCDGVVDGFTINENIIKPLMKAENLQVGEHLIDQLMNQMILINEVEKTEDIKDIVGAVTYGDTLLLTESNQALILNSKGFQTRSIMEPEAEKILSGPREGFAESLMLNLSLIHRKLRTNDLKMKFYSIGERSNTQACICYLDSLVDKDILKELYKRLDSIDVDAVLDVNYINEWIRDAPYSPFRTTGYTERPDVVVGKLLEGRIAIFLDGTPVVLTIPYLFIENFQSNEDYYINFFYTSFSRILRIGAFLISIMLPALFVTVVGYHHEMLPTTLMVHLANQRATVPLPAALEVFIMLVVFDLLKETGLRMPTNLGQALSIVGALVIGQAAVEARLVAAPTVIVVALTGITSLLVPRMEAAVLTLQFALLILTVIMGYIGFVVGFSIVIIHILKLHSFGVPQMMQGSDKEFQNEKDIFIRAPWTKMLTRPWMLTKNRIRMNRNGE